MKKKFSFGFFRTHRIISHVNYAKMLIIYFKKLLYNLKQLLKVNMKQILHKKR